MKIIPQNTENLLWNKLYNEYKFTPKIHGQFEWIKIPIENKTYHKDTPWSDEQEHLINSFLEELVSDKMYAFDWQHDYFPQKNISLVIMNIMTLTENVLFIFLPTIRMGIIIYFLILTGNMEYLEILGKKKLL